MGQPTITIRSFVWLAAVWVWAWVGIEVEVAVEWPKETQKSQQTDSNAIHRNPQRAAWLLMGPKQDGCCRSAIAILHRTPDHLSDARST